MVYDSSLLPFFQPNGVLIVGASTSPDKLGYGVARNLLQSGYTGAIHFFSQKSGELFGQKIHTKLSDIPDPIDLAILLVPPDVTPQMIEECGKRGIKSAVIVSAGFREVGGEGVALEQKCIDAACKNGVRFLGPNCIGTIDTHFPLDTTFLQSPMPAKGDIGFISHSGAFCAAVIDWSRAQGFGFSRIVSLGNQADVNETDMLAMLADDNNTKVIVMYMESVSDGKRFVETAQRVTRVKPVIALKVGRFESGQKAASSHTGALAASDNAFDAAFEKAGILRANTTEQMFDWAKALENCPPPKGNRVGVLTNAGGPGVIAADSLEQEGLNLSRLTDSSLQELAALLPPSASIHNPVDMLASASPEVYAACLKIMLADANVDAVMVILPPPPMFKAEVVAEHIIEVARQFEKPVVIALLGSTLIHEARSVFEKSGIPTYPFPERAASALGAICRQAESVATVEPAAMVKTEPIRDSGNIEELLAMYDIPTAVLKLARDEHEAKTMAEEIGFPVVMKIASSDISHKSDVDGVVTNIKDVSTLQSAFSLMIERVKDAMPGARIDGVHIQRQAPSGQDVIIGMARDALFGPLMMFGSGGVEVEGLKDVAFALAPLSTREAREMVRKTWAGRKLKGFRNIPSADEEAVIQILLNLSRLASEHEVFQEIEINPLRVFEEGAMALDVRFKTFAK